MSARSLQTFEICITSKQYFAVQRNVVTEAEAQAELQVVIKEYDFGITVQDTLDLLSEDNYLVQYFGSTTNVEVVRTLSPDMLEEVPK